MRRFQVKPLTTDLSVNLLNFLVMKILDRLENLF